MKKIIIVQILLFFLSACEKTALITSTDSVSRPVVEAYLSPGHTPEVRISHQLAFGSNDTLVQPILGLNVMLETENLVYPLAYSDADSAYVGDGSWQVLPGKTYLLRFELNGNTITAETFVPLKPEGFTASASSIAIPQFGSPGSGGGSPTIPDPVALTWLNNDGAYYLVVAENLEADPEAIFEESGSDNRPRRPTFRSEPEQTNKYEISFQNFEYFGTHRLVLFRLNAEYASLYDDNGNSSQNLSSPYSNVLGGLGIFTGIHSDTLMLEVTKQ
jgi:hypothetical protein